MDDDARQQPVLQRPPAPPEQPQYQPGRPVHEPQDRQGNVPAVLSWVLALPCAPAGLALGVVGLVLARRRGGAGRVHAVVGVAASAAVAVTSALALAVAAVVVLTSSATGADLVPSRGHDDTVTSVSAAEQAFLDGLYESTHAQHDDADLLAMGRAVCAAMAAGATPPQADADLLAAWGDLDLDAAYDVEWEATHQLCPDRADAFEQWDPATTDAPAGAAGGAGSDAAVVVARSR